MDFVGLIGIIVALVLFLVLVYKGCAPYWAAIICAIIVALTNRMGIVEAVTDKFVRGMVDVIISLFSVVFLGAIFGRVYQDTGAAESIANALMKGFVLKREGRKRITAAIIVLLVVGALCTMGGIDGYVLVFTLFPISLVFAKVCDIPRRFVPALLCLNCAFIFAPGSPQVYNIMAVAGMKSQIPNYVEKGAFGIVGQLESVSATSGVIPGIVATIIVAVLSCITLIKMINKAKDNGEHFDFGPLPAPREDEGERKLPHVVVAILPLVLVFILFSILGLNVFLALGAGIILGLVTMFPYLPKVDARGRKLSTIGSIVNTLNIGAGNYPNALLNVVTPAGLAGVVTATAAFGMVVGALGGIHIAPMVLLIIVVCVIVAITSSPPAALMIALPMFVGATTGPLLAQAAEAASVLIPLNPHAIVRVSAIAAATFETLPFNGMIMLCLGLPMCTHKESYKPMFLMTVFYIFIATIVAALLFTIPGIV
jgi:H+/gluconate symporter-like permease